MLHTPLLDAVYSYGGEILMKSVRRSKLLKAASIALDVFLSLIIVCLVYYVGRAVMAPSTSGVITVSEVKENYIQEDLEVDISRPVVSGFSNRAFERQLNLKIQNQISLNRRLAETYTQQNKSFFEDHAPYILPFAFHTEYWVKSSEGIFSLKVMTYLWNGGSGMPLTSYYNADIVNNEMLTLGELFIDNSYEERIKKYISYIMPDNFTAYHRDDWFNISEKTKFFIMDSNLYIAFSKYELSSGSEGEPEFLIPTEEIKDLLKEEYKQIFI